MNTAARSRPVIPLILGALGLAGGIAGLFPPLSGGGVAVAGLTYSVAAAVIAARISAFHPFAHFGTANAVTLGRLVCACLFLGLAADVVRGAILTPTAALHALTVAVCALAADALDGWCARRSASSSAFGARFDMEVDAAFILALSAIAWATDKAGVWVLASGMARYLYVAAGAIWPALQRPLAFSQRRRVIAAIQCGVLVVLLAPIIVPPLSELIALVGVMLLAYSFAADIWWQVHRAPAVA